MFRPRPARSAILRARPARLRSPASLMTGLSGPRGVSTAIERYPAAECVTSPLSLSTVAFIDGCDLSASMVALAKKEK